ATASMICTLVQPVPTTATRLPASSQPSSQCVAWNQRPPKCSSPGTPGSLGAAKKPAAVTTTFAVAVAVLPPARYSTCQLLLSSSQFIPVTSAPKRKFSRTPYLRTTRLRYSRYSGPDGCECVHSRLISNENE